MGIDKDEASKLADKAMKVSEHYGGVGASAKTLAWIGFAMACGSIYAPRVAAIKLRLMTEAEEAKKRAATPNVINFGP